MKIAAVAILAAFVIAVPNASSTETPEFGALDQIPIQDGGRIKPYFVFAEESLLSLTGRTSLRVEGERMPADEVITRMWLGDRNWREVPMILVDYLPLKDECGLDATQKLFPYETLAGNVALQEMLNRAAAERARDQRTPLRGVLKEASDVGLRMALFEMLLNGSAFRVVPSSGAVWQLVPRDHPDIQMLREAALSGDGGTFQTAAGSLSEWLAEVQPDELPPAWKIQLETFTQRFHPFRWAWIFYALATIILAVTSTAGRQAGYQFGMGLAVIGALFMIFGFTARTLISGRAPVTNMYESIIWVALGTVLFALLFEAIYRSRYFLMGASPVAVVSLMVADAAPLKFDPGISPLVPVLQSNFWLTTHVLTITLSYAAFALALGVAHIALGKVIGGKRPNPSIYNYVYRCLQAGVFLLAVGTILGAVWANYSWGRFWDWDPKETWALVALLSYLFILHGRVAGKWAGFGISVGAILGFLTILMAWYGVNFVLGVGLHSYGFGTGGLGYAVAFVVTELAFVALAIFRYRSLPKKNSTESKTSAPKALA